MLYLHCGWPRTGTSSFQAALATRREGLAEAGIVYPLEWRPRGSDAHHGLVAELIDPASASEAGIERFRDYLRSHSERTVVLSTEALTNWLAPRKREPLIRLARTALAATPVTCVWTLRRVDELFTSLYLHRIVTGKRLPPPTEYFLNFAAGLAGGFQGLAELAGAAGRDSLYVRYEADGSHHDEILRALGVPDALRSTVVDSMRAGPRMNLRLTQKAAAAILFCDEVASRAGAEIPQPALRRALRNGELRFADDAPCELVGAEVRARVHQQALGAARKAGLSAYIEFFEDAEIDAPSPTPLDPDLLTRADLQRIVTSIAVPTR